MSPQQSFIRCLKNGQKSHQLSAVVASRSAPPAESGISATQWGGGLQECVYKGTDLISVMRLLVDRQAAVGRGKKQLPRLRRRILLVLISINRVRSICFHFNHNETLWATHRGRNTDTQVMWSCGVTVIIKTEIYRHHGDKFYGHLVKI